MNVVQRYIKHDHSISSAIREFWKTKTVLPISEIDKTVFYPPVCFRSQAAEYLVRKNKSVSGCVIKSL
jgi:hypothetical protein